MAQVKLRRVAARFPASFGTRAQPGVRGRGRRPVGGGCVGRLVGKLLQMLFELLIAFDDALLVRVVHRDFLLQHKQQVWLPRAFETFGDHVLRRMDAGIARPD
jgi:hypothetical protein